MNNTCRPLSTAVRSLAVTIVIAFVIGGRIDDTHAQTDTTSHAAAFTMTGDVALWTVAIKPDKTADFERVIARLQYALTHSSNPARRQQADGWKVVKMDRPMPDGNVVYVHLISPVVKGADYAVLQILYDELPDERQDLYQLYRGAFAQNLALSSGAIVMKAAAAVP